MSIRKQKSSLVNKLIKPAQLASDQIVHHFSKYVTLVEDTFGMLFDTKDEAHLVKRFTWTNHNKISVSVITYGARIVSMKLPDRGANVDEVVLGSDDLAGYLFYEKYGFGATFGRTTTKLNRSTYIVDGKQYWLQPNDGEHHDHGGDIGLDKVNWVPYIEGKKLHLSYMSTDGDQGYPGDLHIRMTFELTTGAEFRIAITANTTKITPVDITNLTYVNLAGHHAGVEELKKHELLINANCYTPMDDNNEFPTGEMLNVVHTKFDFQVPLLLSSVMKDGPEGAYDQNYCVNRGVHQGDAFVARLVHPYKGRVLEIYSNQRGVNFSNAPHFPEGHFNIPVDLQDFMPLAIDQELISKNESVFLVIGKLADYFREIMNEPPEEYRGFLKNLTKKLMAQSSQPDLNSMGSLSSQLELIDTMSDFGHGNFNDYDMLMFLKPLEYRFLKAVKEFLPYVTEDMPFEMVKLSIDEILERQTTQRPESGVYEEEGTFIQNLIDSQIERAASRHITYERNSPKSEDVEEEEDKIQVRKSILRHSEDPKELRCGVPMPPHYKANRITGRGGVVYKRYGGIALRTQGYPSALQIKGFPSPILRPNETYHHTITYKFWVLAGNPAKWLRRLEVGPCVDVSDLSANSTSGCQ